MKAFLIILTFACISTVSYGNDRILSRKALMTIIGSYPERGSSEEQTDHEILLQYQNERTKSDCEIAADQANLDIDKVFVEPSGPLTSNEMRKTRIEIRKLMSSLEINIHHAKNIYNRPRPYLKYRDIKPCIPHEISTSFPSGHATFGRAISKFLAAAYPQKTKALMKLGDQIGTNRIIGGVHYPSDVEAGRKLGDALVEMYLQSEFSFH